MSKLDESKVRWIVRQKRNGEPTARVAETVGVSPRWVTRLARRYRDSEIDDIVFPQPMGRPRGGMPGRLEESTVVSAYYACIEGSTLLTDSIEAFTGLRIPYSVVHEQLKAHGLARIDPRKSGQRRTARYVKRFSNTMRRTDYKLLPNGMWLISYQDDASRKIVGWGVFEKANTANALKVLAEAIAAHGVPRAILSDHGSTFYDNESSKRAKGENKFERRLRELGIRHIPARASHPQTNGKIERVHGEIERKVHLFEDASAGRTTRSGGGALHVGGPFHTAPATDPLDRFFDWFNNDRPNMALGMSRRETPAQAFKRKLPKPGDDIQHDLVMSGAYE